MKAALQKWGNYRPPVVVQVVQEVASIDERYHIKLKRKLSDGIAGVSLLDTRPATLEYTEFSL
jgi:hypothetical protein